MKLFRRLLSATPEDGTGTPETTPETPAPTPSAPPPAAKAVTESDAKPEDAEEIVRLKREADDAKRLLKERETECAHLQDENHRLKQIPTPAPTTPAKPKNSAWTFFDEDD